MKNLIKRLATAAVAVPILLLIFYHGGLYYLAFICLLAVLASLEFFSLAGHEIGGRSKAYMASASALLCAGAYFGLVPASVFFTLLVLVSMALEFGKEDFTDSLRDIGVRFVSLVYFGWMFAHGVLLRNMGSDADVALHASQRQGISDPGFFLVVLAVSCTFLNDTGAFAFGKMFGRRKLARHISSGKTVAGLVGGFCVAIVCALAVNLMFGAPLAHAWAVLYGAVIAGAAVAGDLFESAIKRSAGVKDSGSIVPGHGGVLDRFDSLIFVFPCVYYLSLFFYRASGAFSPSY